ncbi:MAG: YbaB/EbfC family nucleoid-associated protein [Bacteroidia bacterium]|nr:YbaB/EbfC family nucleoid-associated protein [Bacteroidia bacterium]
MKKKAEEIKARMSSIEATETLNGISVTCTADRAVKNITLTDQALLDREMLEDQLCVLINRTLESAASAGEAEMKELAGPMMPGLSGLFGG